VKRYATLILAVGLFSQPVCGQLLSRPATTQPTAAGKVVPAAKLQVARAVAIRAVAVQNNIKAQREQQKKSIMNIPDGGSFKLTDLVHFSMVDGRLKGEWVGNSFPMGPTKRIKIEGSDATWLVNRFNNGANPYFNLTRYDFDGPGDGFWMSQISCQEGMNVTSMYAQGAENCDIAQLSFVQQPNIVTINLYGVQNNLRQNVLNAHAQDLQQLRNEHPDEVSRHLIPILRQMTGQPLLRPGSGDVYRVFTSIPADPAIVQKIESYLPAMTSIDPIERDKAMKSLRELGDAGALAALRFDPDLLLPEQFNRLNALVALHSRMIIEDPAQTLKDPNFLIDCFEDDDLRVRVAAKAALEKVFDHAVEYDPNAPASKRTAAAEMIRRKLEQVAAHRRIVEEFDLP
jgi:hypothetical protein